MSNDRSSVAARFRFNRCLLDESTLELSVDGQVVELERKPLEVLRHFLRHPGKVLAKDDILQAVWPGRVLSETVLSKAISRLREVCGETEAAPLIKTQHGYGYRLVAVVTVEPLATAPRIPAVVTTETRTEPEAPHASTAVAMTAITTTGNRTTAPSIVTPALEELRPKIIRIRTMVGLIGGLLVLALGYLVYDHAGLRAMLAGTTAGTGAALGDQSVAVLPFENLSVEPDNAYFAVAIQDEILTKLSKINALKVISRTSTQHYLSSPENLPEIARQLGVANILEGSVQKAGNAVHISVQLIRADTDEHLWAESYDRKLDDIFAVQGEVAQAVAKALDARLSGAERKTLSAKLTGNAEAYSAYLRGRALIGSGNGKSVAALTWFQEAARLDPEFTLAHVEVAVVASDLYFERLAPAVATPEVVRLAVETALRQHPDMGEVLLARGYYRFRVQQDYAAGLSDFESAHRKLPNDPDVLQALLYIERRLDHWQRAEGYAQKLLQLDPRNLGSLDSIVRGIYFPLRRLDDVRRLLAQGAEIDPDNPALLTEQGHLELAEGHADAARAIAERLQRLPGGNDFATWLLLKSYRYARQWDHVIAIAQAELPAGAGAIPMEKIAFATNLGDAQFHAGREADGRATFERIVRSYPLDERGQSVGDSYFLGALTISYTYLGRKDAALAASERAIELYRHDRLQLTVRLINRMWAKAILGDREAAIADLPGLMELPGGLTAGELEFDPWWDCIRDDPRVQALIRNPPPTQLDAKP